MHYALVALNVTLERYIKQITHKPFMHYALAALNVPRSRVVG